MKYQIGEQVRIEAIGYITRIEEVDRYDPQLKKDVKVIGYSLSFNHADGKRGYAFVEEILLYPLKSQAPR